MKNRFPALLGGGVVLLVFGIRDGLFRFGRLQVLHGSPTDKAVWMLTAGAVATVVGLG